MKEKLEQLKQKQKEVSEAKVNAMKLEQELNSEIHKVLGIEMNRPADIISVADMILRFLDATKNNK